MDIRNQMTRFGTSIGANYRELVLFFEILGTLVHFRHFSSLFLICLPRVAKLGELK